MAGIKDVLESAKKLADALPAIEKLLAFIGIHWRAVTAALGLGSLYAAAWYTAFRSPQEPVRGYLRDITEHRLQAAWDRFHPDLQRSRWAGDVSEFSSGYSSTVSDTLVEISTEDESWLPNKILSSLLANTIDVTLLSSATDTLEDKTCAASAPPPLCLIAQLAEPITYQTVIRGNNFPIQSAGDRRKMVEVRRQLKSRFRLQRDGLRNPWKIIDIHLHEIRIPI